MCVSIISRFSMSCGRLLIKMENSTLMPGQALRVAFSTIGNLKRMRIGNMTGSGCLGTSVEVYGPVCSFQLDRNSCQRMKIKGKLKVCD